MGDRVQPAIEPSAPATQSRDNRGNPRQLFNRANDFLLDSSRIGNVKSHYDKYRRYVILQSSQIFQSLVTMYENLLRAYWHHFRRFVETFEIPQNTASTLHAARCYISAWFYDLYAFNRDAVRGISTLAFNERFNHEILPISFEYDAFLTTILDAIRPTPIHYTSEYALYIPIVHESPQFQTDNPFQINGFTYDPDLFYGLLQIMKDNKRFKIQTVSTHTTGRPFWLLDWHTDDQVCAWFPREQNYSDDDVTLAYILGVPCTPKLGPRDHDEWTILLPGEPLPTARLTSLERIQNRTFFGAFEVRTLEVEDRHSIPDHIIALCQGIVEEPSRKRKKTPTPTSSGPIVISEPSTAPTEAQAMEIIVPQVRRYRIVDWCYYSRVILYLEQHTRTGAHRIFCIE